MAILDSLSPTSDFFTFIVLGYKFCYPWIPRAVIEELSSQHRNEKLLKFGDGPETRETKLDSMMCCRDFETKEQKGKGREVVLSTLLNC